MKMVYAVTKSAIIKQAVIACESREDAIVLAEQINFIPDGGSLEEFVFEIPLIEAGE